MSELLKIVLSLSLSGTLLLFILLVFKPLYKNKLSKRWQYYIWLIVILRMLLPFSAETTLVSAVFAYTSEDSYIMPTVEPQAPRSAVATAPTLSMQAILSKAYENLWILWAAVAFALLIRKITMYQSFVRYVKAGWAEVSDLEILNMLADAEETVGVKRPVELFTNPLISTPMLLGFFRPYIILPSIALDRTELVYIMRHELTHYRRLDMFYKWLVQITVCLHWFNPFAYILAKEVNKCCELSCDEAIIRTLDEDEKKAYGDTLLNALKAMGSYKDKLAAVTLTEGAEQLKERLDAIMKCKRASKLTVSIMFVLTLVLAVGATAIGAYAVPYEKQPDEENLTREESLTISFAPFRSYGLVYNVEQDRALFNGQEVKAFVDIRDMFPGGTYSFDLGYIEPDSNSTLYLMAVRDENGLLMGIQEMSKELQSDLYDIGEDALPVEPTVYVVFDGTTSLVDLSITATDKHNAADTPKTVADWILTCQGSDKVYVKRSTQGGTVDAWIYYHSDFRMAWNMRADGTTLKFVLTDNAPKAVSGATLIHYQAPEAYQDLEVFFESKKLKISVQ